MIVEGLTTRLNRSASQDTVNRLADAVTKLGMSILARIKLAAAAAKACRSTKYRKDVGILGDSAKDLGHLSVGAFSAAWSISYLILQFGPSQVTDQRLGTAS